MDVNLEKFMAAQAMKKWVIVALDGQGCVIMASPEHNIPIGILNEDCFMGDIVEVMVFKGVIDG